jgi:transcriptional regulator with XRE-family HTH domain
MAKRPPHLLVVQLEAWRTDQGLTPETVAKRLGVTPGSYGNWRYGVRTPNDACQQKIKRLLDLEADRDVKPAKVRPRRRKPAAKKPPKAAKKRQKPPSPVTSPPKPPELAVLPARSTMNPDVAKAVGRIVVAYQKLHPSMSPDELCQLVRGTRTALA